jgi:lichenan operon transcriptional antiterminator
MIQRAQNKIFMKNPLTLETKTSYPLIYDMAVFVANEIRDSEKIFINEDEITFIAFHIGTYLENNKNNTERITCVFVYADYHDMHLPTLAQIRHTFKDDLNIIKIIPVNELSNEAIECDIVISTVDAMINTSARVVRVSIFLSHPDIELLRNEINAIKQKKKKQIVVENVKRFIGRKLFKKEFYTQDEFEMINVLSAECYQLGLCQASFKDEVLERESLSSTSFNNFVAVPHSLKHNALSSFMSVVINEKSMQWGENSVNIIILIGISKEDRAAFRRIFDDLITILCEPIYVNQLIKCQDYDDFIDTLTALIEK